MESGGWDDLKEEICTHLSIGKENGEAELETITRIVWLERQKCLIFNYALETIKATAASALEENRGAGFTKGKVLKWKARSHPTASY